MFICIYVSVVVLNVLQMCMYYIIILCTNVHFFIESISNYVYIICYSYGVKEFSILELNCEYRQCVKVGPV